MRARFLLLLLAASCVGGRPSDETDVVDSDLDTDVPLDTDLVDSDTDDPVDTDPVDTDTDVVDTDTGVADTDTGVVDTDTGVADTDIVDTDTDVLETDTDVADTDTDVVDTDTDVVDTDTDVVVVIVDADGDGVLDVSDACANGVTGWTSNASTDHDGEGCKDDDPEDDDDDGDGVLDVVDDCDRGDLGWTATNGTDGDDDGCRDAGEDDDDDNDGATDAADCDDDDDTVFPGAPEACGQERDCDVGTVAVCRWSDVWPIFRQKCTPCHAGNGSGGHNMAGAVMADAYDDSQLASYYAPGGTKGAAALVRIRNGSMPQGRGCSGNPVTDAGDPDCLSAAQQAVLQSWIDNGQLE